MKTMNRFYKILGWWENLNAGERFALMKKYNIASFSNKAIERIYKAENIK